MKSVSGGGRLGGVSTLLGTLLVVAVEFGLLTAVYQRAVPTGHEAATAGALAAEWKIVDPATLAQVKADTAADLTKLQKEGLPAAELSPVRAAVGRTGLDGQDVTGTTDATAAIQHLMSEVSDRQRRVNDEAEWFYVCLLTAASLGWMLWFKRLVSHHRILEHRLTEEQSRTESEQRLAALVRQAADVIALCDLDGTIRFVTSSSRRMLGVTPDDLTGHRLAELVIDEDTNLFQRLLTSVPDGEDRPLQVRVRHQDQRILHIEGTASNLISDPSVSGMIVTLRDVTARVELQSQLTYQAFHDALTGLANRQLFTDRLEHALAQRDLERPLVVLFCDLDEFKNINDSLGHGVGDRILATVSRRAEQVVRPGDTVARLGGDEFAILLEGTDAEQGEAIATRLLQAIGEPIALDDSVLMPQASIGLATAVPGITSSEELLRNADVAMYMAKDRGKGTIAVYEAALHAEALDRLAIRADLQRAIRNDELVLHYQPTIDLASGRVAGFEALVRWQHPDRGLLPPSLFVPIAEQTGLIHALGSWVLKTACRAAVDLCRDSTRTMSVNVSSQQLAREDFVGEVFEVLATTPLRAEQLTLEITETALVNELEVITERLGVLRGAGIRIAIDDFGTGYNSLAYLRDLPIDVLKVDKAFVDCVISRDQDATLTQAILQMSASLNLVTVAEGVEHPDQAGWLTEANCRYGQGYLWSRPVPIDEAKRLLRRERADQAPHVA